MVHPLSITEHGRTEPFYFQVSRGQVLGHRVVIRSGLNPAINTGTTVSLTDNGGLYVFPSAATIMTVSSTSALDTSAGTGARMVLVSGLDANYNEIFDLVALQGQTPVSTSVPFLRVHNVSVTSVGSTGSAAGDIYIGVGVVTLGVPATVYGRIRVGWNTTQMVQYTVPAGHTAYMTDITGSATASTTNKYTLMSIRQRLTPTGPFLSGGSVVVSGSVLYLQFDAPRGFAEKTEFDITANTTDTNVTCAVTIRFIVVKNDVEINQFLQT